MGDKNEKIEVFNDLDDKRLRTMNRRISEQSKYRIKLIDNNLCMDNITIQMISINMARFLKFIEIETLLYPVLEGYKITRCWIFRNMYKVMIKRLINPKANKEILENIENQYTNILEIYVVLNEYLLDIENNIYGIATLLNAFFVIDTYLKIQYHSKYDFSSYILNNNTYFLLDGKTIGPIQSND